MITIPGTPDAIRNRLMAALRSIDVHLNDDDLDRVLAALQEPLDYTPDQVRTHIREERAKRIAAGPAGELAAVMKELTP